MQIRLASLLVAVCCFGQPSGTVTASTGHPGNIQATAGSLSCQFLGDTYPASNIYVVCGNYCVQKSSCTPLIPIPTGSYFMMDLRDSTNDSIAAIFQSNPSGGVNWQISATPNGGISASGQGTI